MTTVPKKMSSGFSWDEALFLANLSKEVYQVFQHQTALQGTALKELFMLLYPKADWDIVHIIRNRATTARGLIFKHQSRHQYVLVFRGSVVTTQDNTMASMSTFSSIPWEELVAYPPAYSPKILTVHWFWSVYDSIADQIRFFFKTLSGQLDADDFQHLKHLDPQARLGCLGAIADAGAVRLGSSFGQKVRDSIFQGLQHQDMTSTIESETEEMPSLSLEQSLIDLAPITDALDVYVTGHSLGGCLANLGALALKRTIKKAHLALKVYTLGAPKIGNQAFANFYNQEIGAGFSYRIENTLDVAPYFPLALPFPFNLMSSNSLQVGDYYLGDYAGVGEVHTITGLGSQGVSIDSGGAFELLGGIPFPHGFDVYIQLLEEQHHYWVSLLRPIRSVLGEFMGQLLQRQTTEITEDLQHQLQGLQTSVNELRNQVQVLQHPEQEGLTTIDRQDSLCVSFPRLKPDLLATIAAKAQLINYAPGTKIIRQGERANAFYIIVQGQVEIVIESSNGAAQVLRERGAGDYFGEIGLLSGGVRTATVQATADGPVQLLALDKATFQLMITESETIATQLAYSMATRAINTPS
ncbi:MAG: cyclic nucleotide-binding domain-containing protein [Cyanobacteria bacterium P01_C01_bin.118]